MQPHFSSWRSNRFGPDPANLQSLTLLRYRDRVLVGDAHVRSPRPSLHVLSQAPQGSQQSFGQWHAWACFSSCRARQPLEATRSR